MISDHTRVVTVLGPPSGSSRPMVQVALTTAGLVTLTPAGSTFAVLRSRSCFLKACLKGSLRQAYIMGLMKALLNHVRRSVWYRRLRRGGGLPRMHTAAITDGNMQAKYAPSTMSIVLDGTETHGIGELKSSY